jgi:sulfur relay (sulfurtransferase) DsrC/TusE family protein
MSTIKEWFSDNDLLGLGLSWQSNAKQIELVAKKQVNEMIAETNGISLKNKETEVIHYLTRWVQVESLKHNARIDLREARIKIQKVNDSFLKNLSENREEVVTIVNLSEELENSTYELLKMLEEWSTDEIDLSVD